MKTVVVTGASSGIGKAIYDGYRALNYEHDGPALQQYNVIGISRRGPDIYHNLDRSIPSVKPNVDILINCAGVMRIPENLDHLPLIFNINIVSPYLLIEKMVKPNMLIVNIASISGMQADPETPLYGATKAALISLTMSLAKKYANINTRVNCISPGFYPTQLVPGEVPKHVLEGPPIGWQKAQLDDIFKVIRMMEELPYMTGANIVIDGGQLCKI